MDFSHLGEGGREEGREGGRREGDREGGRERDREREKKWRRRRRRRRSFGVGATSKGSRECPLKQSWNPKSQTNNEMPESWKLGWKVVRLA